LEVRQRIKNLGGFETGYRKVFHLFGQKPRALNHGTSMLLLSEWHDDRVCFVEPIMKPKAIVLS